MDSSSKHIHSNEGDPAISSVSLEIEAANDIFTDDRLLQGAPANEAKSLRVQRMMMISKIKTLSIFISTVVLIPCCVAIISLLTSVVLLISFVVTRILQLFGHGDDYAKLVRHKHIIRLGLCLNAAVFLIELGIFFPFAKHVPRLEHMVFDEMPLTKWVTLGCIMCGMHLLSFLLYVPIHGIVASFMHQFSLNVGQAIAEIIDGVIVWWATTEVIKHVPTIKHYQILGFPAQKWIKVSIVVLVGYNLIIILTHLIVLLLSILGKKLQLENLPEFVDRSNKLVTKLLAYTTRLPYVVYCAKWMTVNIIFVMSSLLLLLTWIFYFGSHLDMNSSSVRSFWERGKWSFLSLFIFSFLWFIKGVATLVWDNYTIKENLWQQIFDISRELYFFGWLDSQEDDDEDENKGDVGRHRGFISSLASLLNFAQLYKMANTRETFMSHLKKVATLCFLYVDLQQMIQFLFEAKTYLFREELSNPLGFYDDNSSRARNNVSKMLENFKSKKRSQSPDEHFVDYLRIKLAKLVEEYSDDYAYSQFIKWREDTYNQCSNLENIIRSAKEVGNCLDRIISWLLIGVIFIVWLLLTGLASTKVLLIIASPLLAATFIFGETCKTLFEGIIFVFVVHPFDIGDTCEVDKEKLEVISIGVWTTIFTKLDDSGQRLQEVVTYPNKELNSKVIINYKAEFNWSDELKFCLESEIINYYLDHERLKDELVSKLKKHELPIRLNSLEMKINKCMEGSWILDMSLQYKTTISSSNMTMTSYESAWLKKKLRRRFEDIVQQIIRDLTPDK